MTSSLFLICKKSCATALLVLAITPSLSSESQTNSSSISSSSKYSSSGDNGNDNINTNNSQIAVFPANSKPYGLTYGEWTAKWWQWGYSIPKNTNAAYDDTGKNCAQKQFGPVWFLAGTFGHPVNPIYDGILDLRSIQQSIKNLNLTSDERIVVVDHNGTAIVDYSHSSLAANNNNVSSSSKLEDFSYLNSVKAVRKGNAGSIFETVNGIKMLSIYKPIQLGNRFWGVILIKLLIFLI